MAWPWDAWVIGMGLDSVSAVSDRRGLRLRPTSIRDDHGPALDDTCILMFLILLISCWVVVLSVAYGKL